MTNEIQEKDRLKPSRLLSRLAIGALVFEGATRILESTFPQYAYGIADFRKGMEILGGIGVVASILPLLMYGRLDI